MRAALGESFYNVAVTAGELWRAVGKKLELARHERKWRPMDVERAGGPSYKTVQAIELGQAGNVKGLEKCARALDLDLVDILYAVLESQVTPLTPEAAHVIRAFSETTVAGRTAMLALANALPRVDAAGAPVTTHQSPVVHPSTTPRKTR